MKILNQTKLIVKNLNNLNTLETFLNSSSDVICIIDINGHFKYVNNSFIEMSGYLESNLLLKTFFDFLDPKETVEVLKKIASLSKDNEEISFDSKYFNRDKLHKTISWKMVYIEQDVTLLAIGKDRHIRKLSDKKITVISSDISDAGQSSKSLARRHYLNTNQW